MDWSRAKTILLISFLFLNLLLGYQLWSSRADQSASASDSPAAIEETKQFLASKNIHVNASVPKDAPKLKQITGLLNDKYRNPQEIAVNPAIRFPGLFSRSSLKDAMTRAGVEKPAAYKTDTGLSHGDIYVMTQMAGNLPLFDITLQLFRKNGEIVGYKQAYIEVQSGGGQTEQKVISAYTALRSLAEAYLPEGSVIQDVRLGYHGQRYDSETQVLPPCWRVVLETGDIYYVQAFSGAVEGAQSAAKK